MPAGFEGEFPQPARDRIYLGKIFELNAANILSWKGLQDDRLPAGRVTIPAQPESRYRPYLLTRIEVYGENRLQDYDCSLTPPQPLRGKIKGGDTLQFHYRLGSNPQLCHEAVVP